MLLDWRGGRALKTPTVIRALAPLVAAAVSLATAPAAQARILQVGPGRGIPGAGGRDRLARLIPSWLSWK